MNERSNATRKITRLAGMMIHVVAGASLLALATVAAANAATAGQNSGFASGALRIAFVDAGGSLQQKPCVDVTNAYPGMPIQRTTITLRNTGSLAANYAISSADVRPAGPGSLEEVLVVRVRNLSSGELVYGGTLAGLSFVATTSPLRPGIADTYVVSIGWPDTAGNDDLYQGQSLSFALEAEAESVIS